MSRRKRKVLLAAAGVLVMAAALVLWQVHTPGEVPWVPVQVGGLSAWQAEGLVIQEVQGGEVWATQGYSIYHSSANEAFVKVTTLRCTDLEPALAYLRVVRDWTARNDLADILLLEPDLFLAFAAGYVWQIDLKAGTCRRVHTLRHFGRGVGRGVMPQGMVCDDQGSAYYGEYFRNDDKGSVRLYRSDDKGLTWTVAYEFAPREIRHIHGVLWDPYGKRLWMLTGDDGHECRIGYSTNRGETFTWIAQGEQLYRACSLLFTRDAVVWGTDTKENQLVRWSRENGRIEVLQDLPSPTYYSQRVGETGLLGLAERTATAWMVDSPLRARKILEFHGPANWQKYGAPPGVRLARGLSEGGEWLYVNPIRTVEYPSAILRFDAAGLSPQAETERKP